MNLNMRDGKIDMGSETGLDDVLVTAKCNCSHGDWLAC